MNLQATIRFLIVIGLILARYDCLFAQQIAIETKELESIVKEWNYAHNARSVETFHRIYADQLLFYTETLSREKCVDLKQDLFDKKPDFEQRITSGLMFTPYTSGIIKCEFKKEVRSGDKWRSYACYLLLSYLQATYMIVGESDYETDRILKYTLQIGMPMDIPVGSPLTGGDTVTISTSSSSQPSSKAVKTDSTETGAVNFDSAVASVQSLANRSMKENITIPRVLLYTLVGLLFIFVTLVMVYQQRVESTQPRRQKKLSRKQKKRIMADPHEVFQKFVISLFDPLYFRLLYRNGESSQPARSELRFSYCHHDIVAKFSIRCMYTSIPLKTDAAILEVKTFDQFIRQSFENNLIPYCILGAAGIPEDPAELFLIPLQSIKSATLSYQDLLPFKKSGMFYYNPALKSLR